MSSLPQHRVWNGWFPGQDNAQCPICSQVTMLEDSSLGTWHRAYIISPSNGGRDIFPNVIPACPQCYQKKGNLNLSDYLVKIGKIHSYQKDLMNQQFLQEFANHDAICKYIKPTGHRCSNKVYNKSSINCEKHTLFDDGGFQPMDCRPDYM